MIIVAALFLIVIGSSLSGLFTRATPATPVADGCVAADAVEVSIIYAPEMESFLPPAIEAFNCAFAEGRNPLTGAQLAEGEQRVHVSRRVDNWVTA